MRTRGYIKYLLHEYVPTQRGWFVYFGERVYFPRGSELFKRACEEGIFEKENVRLLNALSQPQTTMFDIGANIGLMSLPVLSAVRDVSVVAFEPSPNSLPFLRRTVKHSRYAHRWNVVGKAASSTVGEVSFTIGAPQNGAFDGLVATGRVPSSGIVQVEATTIDKEWKALGTPSVSVLKCDVEGAEVDVLNGAVECIRTCRPAIMVEWNERNLAPCGVPIQAILDYARANGYELFSAPSLAPVVGEQSLRCHMGITETFLLLAVGDGARRPCHGRRGRQE